LPLALLAFKIFPDTGLHIFDALQSGHGLATLVWHGSSSEEAMPLDPHHRSVLLILTHPIGAIYAGMGMLFSALLASDTARWKIRLTILIVLVLSLLMIALASVGKQPALINVFNVVHLVPNIAHFMSSCTSNLEGIVVGISRIKEQLIWRARPVSGPP